MDLGTYFIDKEVFKDEIKTYVVYSGINLKMLKNDNIEDLGLKCNGSGISGLHIMAIYHQLV